MYWQYDLTAQYLTLGAILVGLGFVFDVFYDLAASRLAKRFSGSLPESSRHPSGGYVEDMKYQAIFLNSLDGILLTCLDGAWAGITAFIIAPTVT